MANTLLHDKTDELPEESCIRSLLHHLVSPNENFQPMNFNFGLLPHKQDYKKKDKKRLLAEQEDLAIREWIAGRSLPDVE